MTITNDDCMTTTTHAGEQLLMLANEGVEKIKRELMGKANGFHKPAERFKNGKDLNPPRGRKEKADPTESFNQSFSNSMGQRAA